MNTMQTRLLVCPQCIVTGMTKVFETFLHAYTENIKNTPNFNAEHIYTPNSRIVPVLSNRNKLCAFMVMYCLQIVNTFLLFYKHIPFTSNNYTKTLKPNPSWVGFTQQRYPSSYVI